MSRRIGWLPLWVLALMGAAPAQKKFALPPVGTVARWEAEQAEIVGRPQIHRHPHASGDAFVEARENTVLRFRVPIPPASGGDEGGVTLRVYPLFWRNSPRTPPRFFPYPLPTLPGPDAVVALGNRFYFTAPVSGQVGIVDAWDGKLLGSIKVGGYLTDIAASGFLFVADGRNGRVAAIDPQQRRVVAEAKVPAAWALDVWRDKVFVASRAQRQLVALKATTLQREQSVSLSAPPVDCDVLTGNKPAVMVRFEPTVLRLADFARLPADRLDYGFVRQRFVAEFGQRGQVGWNQWQISSTTGWLVVARRTEKGQESRRIELPQGAPRVLVKAGNRVLVVTDKGALMVFDATTEAVVGVLNVSDRAFDVLATSDGRKAYAADPASNRVLVVDPQTANVVREIPVPDEPVALELYEPRWWTEDEAPVPQLFVACRKGKAVAVISVADDKVVRTEQLSFEPGSLRAALPPDPNWWQNIPADRLAFELTPRLAVAPAPVLRDAETLQPVSGETSPAISPRSMAILGTGDGNVGIPPPAITLTADNAHTLRWMQDGGGSPLQAKWLDTSTLTNAQGVAPVVDFGAVRIADQPWQRGVWMTPDQNVLLVADSEEFWRWNAPTVRVEKGKKDAVLTVRVQPGVMLDALCVERVLTGEVAWRVTAEAPVAELPEKYRAVFYADEPVRLRVKLSVVRHAAQRGAVPKNATPLRSVADYEPVRLAVRIHNYMGEEVWVRAWERNVRGGVTWEQVIDPRLRDTGVFCLEATLRTARGLERKTFYFMRVPRLERPRLLTRRADYAFIAERVRRYPKLFERYTQWLRESLNTPGFLPASLVSSEFVPQLPADQKKLAQSGGWRRYDLAWRLIALQFAATFLNDSEKEQLRQQVTQLLKGGRTDGYCHFHYHGPFFPGAIASLVDLVAADVGDNTAEVQKMREFLASRLGDMNVFAWTLAAFNDPPSLRERALLFHLMTWLVNVERYFTTHAGKRGGTWWLNQRTACHCPFGAYSFAFFYLRNFLGEDRFHYRPFVQGFLTHALLSRPLNDKRKLLGAPGPPGEPQRWMTASLSRHPLMQRLYGWDRRGGASLPAPETWTELVRQLNSDGELTREQLQRAFVFPNSAANNAPVPFVLPLGLALGWFDPDAPEVDFSELPPTILFDGEGEAVIRSDYGADATEIFFASGVRDHVYRHQPTNLMVWKAGEPLLGTASLHGDHGCPTLNISRGNSWGNVVVIEPSDWRTRWKRNYSHPRGEELAVINRFSDANFRHLTRDQRLDGYTPAEGGFGGGLDLHGHTQSFFLREGHITAFETHPAFDYVAGDATLSWLPSQARFVGRQVVFIRPDWLIVYDRVELGAEAQRADWIATTGLELKVEGDRFFVRSGEATLDGWVLLPQAATLEAHDPATSSKYNPLFDKPALAQKVLEIHAPFVVSHEARAEWRQNGTLRSGVPDYKRTVEFLVVMRVGVEQVANLPHITPQTDDRYAGALIRDGERTVRVRFTRSEVQGGDLLMRNGAASVPYRFVDHVDDTYRHWRNDPRYKRWMTERRFDFIMGER